MYESGRPGFGGVFTMAGRGPAPQKTVRRRNARPAATVLSDDDELRGPELPNDIDWHPRTQAWWAVWRRSMQAQTFTETDWSSLLDTAMVHTRMWSGAPSLASEVRIREAKFGATPEDRARLHIEVDRPARPAAPVVPPPVTSDPRARLKLLDGRAS